MHRWGFVPWWDLVLVTILVKVLENPAINIFDGLQNLHFSGSGFFLSVMVYYYFWLNQKLLPKFIACENSVKFVVP
jgi:hypothetical protein